jgi:hypothetical protein
LRLSQIHEQIRLAPHACETASVKHIAGLELIVDDEWTRVHVTDGVDEAHDASGTTHVESRQCRTECVQMEERITGENIFAVG